MVNLKRPVISQTVGSLWDIYHTVIVSLWSLCSGVYWAVFVFVAQYYDESAAIWLSGSEYIQASFELSGETVFESARHLTVDVWVVFCETAAGSCVMFSSKCAGELLVIMRASRLHEVTTMIPNCWGMAIITVPDFVPAVIHPFVPFQRNFTCDFCLLGFGLADFYMVC